MQRHPVSTIPGMLTRFLGSQLQLLTVGFSFSSIVHLSHLHVQSKTFHISRREIEFKSRKIMKTMEHRRYMYY